MLDVIRRLSEQDNTRSTMNSNLVPSRSGGELEKELAFA